jgi:hypothetical protein
VEYTDLGPTGEEAIAAATKLKLTEEETRLMEEPTSRIR